MRASIVLPSSLSQYSQSGYINLSMTQSMNPQIPHPEPSLKTNDSQSRNSQLLIGRV